MKDDPLEALLQHDVDDRVPPEHERRIREGLGALLAPPTAAPKADPPKVDPPKIDPPTSPPLPDLGTPGALGKLITTGLLVLGGAGVGFVAGRASAPPAPQAIAVNPTSSVPTMATPAPAPSASTATEVSAPVSAPAIPSTAPSAPAAPHDAAPASSAADAFDREQSLLERARTALVRHDAAAAEQALDEADRQFPRPRHAEERDYLRIQTLRERGDAARARDRAKAFLAKYPTSLLRARVEPLAE